jgi:thiosulfate/3-mercaptopyruvate sulfurtransferase
MTTRLLSLVSLLLALATGGVARQASGGAGVLVSTEWLAEHLSDPGLVIVQVTNMRRDYAAGHIPGARYLWPGYIAMSNPDLSYQALPVSQLDSTVEALGISNDSRVILCGANGNVSPTARVFLTLEYLGMGGKVAVLDGGFDQWKKEGRPVSKEAPAFQRGSFTPALKNSVFSSAEEVLGAVGRKGVSIVDARAPGFYDGTTPNGMTRAGHVPGARNLFYSTLVDSTNKMLGSDTLKGLFAAAGVGEGDRVIAYCHVGQTASLVYFAARLLGKEASLYDGSFEEWSGREDLPVELPQKKGAVK